MCNESAAQAKRPARDRDQVSRGVRSRISVAFPAWFQQVITKHGWTVQQNTTMQALEGIRTSLGKMVGEDTFQVFHCSGMCCPVRLAQYKQLRPHKSNGVYVAVKVS